MHVMHERTYARYVRTLRERKIKARENSKISVQRIPSESQNMCYESATECDTQQKKHQPWNTQWLM